MSAPKYLYTVYRNKDDRLMILDGTAKHCCEVLGLKQNTFYAYLSRKDGPYTILRSTRKAVEADMAG